MMEWLLPTTILTMDTDTGKNELKGKKYQDFMVFKGIEYDTRDAGHFLVIMPEGRKMRLLEMRGLPLTMLIDLVPKMEVCLDRPIRVVKNI